MDDTKKKCPFCKKQRFTTDFTEAKKICKICEDVIKRRDENRKKQIKKPQIEKQQEIEKPQIEKQQVIEKQQIEKQQVIEKPQIIEKSQNENSKIENPQIEKDKDYEHKTENNKLIEYGIIGIGLLFLLLSKSKPSVSDTLNLKYLYNNIS